MPGRVVSLNLKFSGTAPAPTRLPLVIRSGLGFLSFALAYSVLRSGGVDLRDWNFSLLLIGLVSLAYWPSNSQASLPSSRIGRFAPLILPGYVALQVLPLPAAIPQIFAPGHRLIFGALESAGLAPALTTIAVDATVTFAHLFRIFGYLLAFLLIREFTTRSLKRNEWLTAIPLILIAAVEALWGVSQGLRGIEASGTYANRNHFAGLIEMVLPFAAAGLIYLARSGNQPIRLTHVFKIVILSAIFLALLAALLDSQSKMGLISGITGLLITGTLWSLSTLRDWKRWAAVCAIIVVSLLVFLFLPSDELVARFGRVLTSSQGASEGRWPIWMDTLRLIAAFPVFGCGLGDYGTAFLKYQTSVIDRTFTYAHNDYLQLVAELGIAGFIILAFVVIPVVARPFRAAARGDSPIRYLAFACAGAISAIALHSFADFNLYIPANAMVLAWILGISASLPLGPRRLFPRAGANPISFRVVVIAISAIVVLYAPAWMLFESTYTGDARAEARFCRIGICDPNSSIIAETRASRDNVSAVSVSDLQRALLIDPASPLHWCDLGDALAASNRIIPAADSFSSAVQLGPFVPPVLLRAASFNADHGQTNTAVSLASRVLWKTTTYDASVFGWYVSHHIPMKGILDAGLNWNPRAAGAYLRYLMTSAADFDGAAILWRWMLGHSYADDQLARGYMEVLFQNTDYSAAAYAWRDYLGPRAHGYQTSNWIYNGDFETDPAGPVLDWEIRPRNGVEVAEDTSINHTGHRSLRLQFDGTENLDYQQVSQTTVVPPGQYRFEAYVRTSGITTDEGIGFRIFDPEQPNRLDLSTKCINGTNDWASVTREIIIPTATRLLEIRVIRQPSSRFDSNIRGTVWIDTVSLSRISTE